MENILSGLGLTATPKTKNAFESINPSTGKCLTAIAKTTEVEYETIVQQAQDAFLHWRTIPAPKRGLLVRDLGDLLKEKKDLLGSLVSLEMGKSKAEGDGEVQEMIDMADFALGQSRMLYGKTMHSERSEHRMYEQWHPLGIVGVISAFNFPVAVWAWNAFVSAICGNVTIWKPSSKTPLCALAVQNLCNRVMQQHGVGSIFQTILSGGSALNERFIQDLRIPLIAFTGSCKTGQHIYETVAKRMGKTLLELGGNNAIIIDQDVNMELAIPAIVFGAVGTSGQRCTTTRRVFIHQSRYQEVCDKLIQAYKQITIGDPLDPKNLMGPLIDQTAVELYTDAIKQLKTLNSELLFGGEVLKRSGFFVEPTLATAQNEWELVQSETFAPILYLISIDHIEDAIAKQNDVPQGLSSALFTNNLQHAELFLSARGSDCGLANINIGTSGAEIGGAFGGEKQTGGGREAGSDAWKAYMRRQTNTINWGNTLPLAQGIEFG